MYFLPSRRASSLSCIHHNKSELLISPRVCPCSRRARHTEPGTAALPPCSKNPHPQQSSALQMAAFALGLLFFKWSHQLRAGFGVDALRFAVRELPGWRSERIRADPGTPSSAPFYGVLLKGDSNNSQQQLWQKRKERKKYFISSSSCCFRKFSLRRIHIKHWALAVIVHISPNYKFIRAADFLGERSNTCLFALSLLRCLLKTQIY